MINLGFTAHVGKGHVILALKALRQFLADQNYKVENVKPFGAHLKRARTEGPWRKLRQCFPKLRNRPKEIW